MEVRADDEDVLEVVRAQPYVDRLGREAAVREREHRDAARPQHARDLRADLPRPREVVDAHDVGDDVERVVVERERRVGVEVLHDVLADLLVELELVLVHAERDPPPRRGLVDRLREVADVRRAEVEDVGVVPRFERLGVVLGQRADRRVVHVEAEARRRVEARVGGLVLARKVRGRERPLGRELRLSQHVAHREIARDGDGPRAAHAHTPQAVGELRDPRDSGSRAEGAAEQEKSPSHRGSR